MLEECKKAGLPEPAFEERAAGLWLTSRKNVWSREYLEARGLDERQIKAMLHARERVIITNADCQELGRTSPETAKRELANLVSKELLI